MSLRYSVLVEQVSSMNKGGSAQVLVSADQKCKSAGQHPPKYILPQAFLESPENQDSLRIYHIRLFLPSALSLPRDSLLCLYFRQKVSLSYAYQSSDSPVSRRSFHVSHLRSALNLMIKARCTVSGNYSEYLTAYCQHDTTAQGLAAGTGNWFG